MVDDSTVARVVTAAWRGSTWGARILRSTNHPSVSATCGVSFANLLRTDGETRKLGEVRQGDAQGRKPALVRLRDYAVLMAGYFLVRQARGPAWDSSCGRREQPGWDQHVAFIDRVSEDGRIALGGPVGEIDGEHVVLVVRAASEDEVRAMFADDPWMDNVLRIESVEPWTLWIGADSLPAP